MQVKLASQLKQLPGHFFKQTKLLLIGSYQFKKNILGLQLA